MLLELPNIIKTKTKAKREPNILWVSDNILWVSDGFSIYYPNQPKRKTTQTDLNQKFVGPIQNTKPKPISEISDTQNVQA